MFRRIAVGAAVAAVLPLSLTGCAGEKAAGGAEPAAVRLLAETARRAGQVETYIADMTVESSGPRVTTTVRSRLRPRVAMSAVVSGGKTGCTETRLIDRMAYCKLDEPAWRPGKPWASASVDGSSPGAGLMADEVARVRRDDPAEQVKALAASTDVRESSERGRNRHLTGTLTFEQALARFDPKIRPERERTYRTLGVGTTRFDLWLDPAGLPSKAVMVVSTSTGDLTTTAVYHDYGRPVDVRPPPAAQVAGF
ncbi:hypothetical protein [Actinomadura macrotermitis]|uniref:Lipoprotein n=1 Tax=Actinomadura macrotermitis TaxID=2585200 RepID=A0A7K0BYA5_9ACTN|nr:hypothetical protein [Actinomadura macrotermitis]MQY06168.1 hypothetical protein [Actinomadura macrotermitis]